MNSFRIGCDRLITWSITSGGEPYDLTGRNIRLKVSTRSAHFFVSPDDFSIDRNKIKWLFRGKDQKYLGPYTITYIENDGMDDMLTFDSCDIFSFVAWSCMENQSSSEDLEISDIDLASDIEVSGIKLQRKLVSVTFQELVSLRNSSGLVPGSFYRITDYMTTTMQESTQSAGHQFDLVVLALSGDTLSERAYAMLHEVESHRELTLTAQNGSTTSYRETEETVDVQGVTYYRWDSIGGGTSVYFNTANPAKGSTPFSQLSNGGMTWDGYFFLNTDPETVYDGDAYFQEAGANLSAWQIWYSLDNDTSRFAWAVPISEGGKGVIYRMIDEFNNDCPYDFKNIVFYSPEDSELSTEYYTFDVANVKDLSITNHCYNNKISPWYNKYIQTLNGIVFKNIQSRDVCHNNRISGNCYNLWFGRNCFFNTIGCDCYSNKFGDTFKFNTLDDTCQNNKFGSDCYSNILGKNCDGIVMSDNCRGNVFYGECESIILGSRCSANEFGVSCKDITLGEKHLNNTFGTECSNIKLPFVYGRRNNFRSGTKNIQITNPETSSTNNQVELYNISLVNDGSTTFTLARRGSDNKILNVVRNSSGVLKIFNIADLV